MRTQARRGAGLALALALATFALAAFPAGAAVEQPPFSPDASAALAKAEDYLNSISTLSARFVQVSSNGVYAEGDIAVSRPGRLRFEYDPPVPIVMVANGLSFLYYDKELEQSSYLPLWETPLWFLIRKEVQLSDKVRVEAIEHDAQTVGITLVESESEVAGKVTLVFGQNPFRLIKWELLDAQGVTTEVTLVNPVYGGELDSDLFDLSAFQPAGGGGANR